MPCNDVTPHPGGEIAIRSGRRLVSDEPVNRRICGDGTGPDNLAASRRVTCEFARLMDGVTQMQCSEFGDNVVASTLRRACRSADEPPHRSHGPV